jgi:hypothetical protein
VTEPVVERIAADYLDRLDGSGDLPHQVRVALHRDLQAATGRDQFPAYLEVSAACAVRVWPIWRAAFSDDLPWASPAPSATVDDPKLRFTRNPFELSRLHTFLDNRLWARPESGAAAAAGYACWAVNRDLLNGGPPSRHLDRQPDFDNQEPAWYASVAEAGTTRDDRNDPSARRAFWTWYLTQAVPRCYSGHPVTGLVMGAQ